jgi:uncharacterized protein (DUF1810 family)
MLEPDHSGEMNRFVQAQDDIYATVLTELRSGRKTSHWMWFVFPQVAGLGTSGPARFYAIKSIGEAHAYLQHPILGPRLLECAETLLSIRGRTAREIFDYPDDMKLKSSMTLFATISSDESVFHRVLDHYYAGERDTRTLRLLEDQRS